MEEVKNPVAASSVPDPDDQYAFWPPGSVSPKYGSV
jgi:hypothetical protein